MLCLVSLVAVLAGCASEAPSSNIAIAVARGLEPLPILHPDAVEPLVTKLDAMSSALPEFALVRYGTNEVSVERPRGFSDGGRIVSSDEVERIALLQAYLLADPAMAVRVEGYFDRATDSERGLALDRAQALVRALLTSTRIRNQVSAVASPGPPTPAAQAAIIFVNAQDLGLLQLPQQ
jgi:hypothetical protein